MRTPMMEKIVHTAKHTVKASVDIHSARPCSLDALRSANPLVCINRVSRLATAMPRWAQNKKAAGQTPAHVRNGLIGSFAN